MRNSPFWLLIGGLMIVLDIYFFQIVKLLTSNAAPRTRSTIHLTYWIFSVLVIALLFLLPYLNLDNFRKGLRATVFSVLIAFFILKLFACIFFLIDDLRRGIQWLWGKIFFAGADTGTPQESPGIKRSVFLSWLGIAVGGSLFTSLLYGFTNKYNYNVKRIPVKFPNLPEAFRGMKVVQISDIHSGSLVNKEGVKKGVDMIMALKPDLILFTGDLVNNLAEEIEPLMDVFDKLKAPMGVYSVFGNHDYGDYVQWESPAKKAENIETLKGHHAKMGWKLLWDEHVPLEKNGQQIALIGIQNYSALRNFARYGNLAKAYEGAQQYPFKILMTHDPTHWDAEVRPKFPDIDLTLSGHTHGFQFGVEIPGFRWSPVQYVYNQWAGLYKEGRQSIYVNRGFGFIGYPGRVGILPEITLLEFA
ncbi:metallophosphoesterase [Flavisolibacter sp. BT320]|nr:metallophosphoesterase [Flavisolibacter longurius]